MLDADARGPGSNVTLYTMPLNLMFLILKLRAPLTQHMILPYTQERQRKSDRCLTPAAQTLLFFP
jgi:hypothetical protein